MSESVIQRIDFALIPYSVRKFREGIVHQRDYILRLIEQIGEVLVELRNRILGRKAATSEVDAELSGVAGRAGLDLELLRGFSLDTLHMFVSPTGEVEPARCWLMAELLYLDGLQAYVEERPDAALESFEKGGYPCECGTYKI